MKREIPIPDPEKFFPLHEVAEHQIYLSFNGDDDARLFAEWWGTEGGKMFQKWAKRQPEGK